MKISITEKQSMIVQRSELVDVETFTMILPNLKDNETVNSMSTEQLRNLGAQIFEWLNKEVPFTIYEVINSRIA